MRSQVATVGGCWFLLALFTGELGLINQLPPLALPTIVLGLTALLLAAHWWIDSFREWVESLDRRWLVAIHLSRFVGIYFLFLYDHGELPFAFAVLGGWGDIVVAGTAVGVMLVSPDHSGGRHLWLTWNGLGWLDLLFVVVTAARLEWADPVSMSALTRLPLSLLPTFVVPLLLASHAVLFLRLRRRQG